jgi:hypothetical protein
MFWVISLFVLLCQELLTSHNTGYITNQSEDATMDIALEEKIQQFNKERDEFLLGDWDLDRHIAFLRHWQPHVTILPEPSVLETAFHKARTGVKTLPTEIRKASKDWLIARGSKPWDDGEL